MLYWKISKITGKHLFIFTMCLFVTGLLVCLSLPTGGRKEITLENTQDQSTTQHWLAQYVWVCAFKSLSSCMCQCVCVSLLGHLSSFHPCLHGMWINQKFHYRLITLINLTKGWKEEKGGAGEAKLWLIWSSEKCEKLQDRGSEIGWENLSVLRPYCFLKLEQTKIQKYNGITQHIKSSCLSSIVN